MGLDFAVSSCRRQFSQVRRKAAFKTWLAQTTSNTSGERAARAATCSVQVARSAPPAPIVDPIILQAPAPRARSRSARHVEENSDTRGDCAMVFRSAAVGLFERIAIKNWAVNVAFSLRRLRFEVAGIHKQLAGKFWVDPSTGTGTEFHYFDRSRTGSKSHQDQGFRRRHYCNPPESV